MVSVLFVKFIEVVTAEPKVTPTPIQIKIKIQLKKCSHFLATFHSMLDGLPRPGLG
jgi:hypothetical protein